MAALLALFLQAFVGQTHIHAVAPAASVAIEQAAHPAGEHVSAAHRQALCVVCQFLSTSGAAALPPAPALVATDFVTYDASAPVLPRAPPAASHAWRSRAPPSLL